MELEWIWNETRFMLTLFIRNSPMNVCLPLIWLNRICVTDLMCLHCLKRDPSANITCYSSVKREKCNWKTRVQPWGVMACSALRWKRNAAKFLSLVCSGFQLVDFYSSHLLWCYVTRASNWSCAVRSPFIFPTRLPHTEVLERPICTRVFLKCCLIQPGWRFGFR